MSNKNYNVNYLLSLANPHPVYHEMRLKSPAFWDEEAETWVLTRYKDIKASLIAPGTYIARAEHISNWFIMSGLMQDYKSTMKVVRAAFSPSNSELHVLHVKNKVQKLLNFAQDKGGVEFISDFVRPLFFSTMSKILGIPYDELPEKDQKNIQQWVYDIDQFSFAALASVEKTINYAGQGVALKAHQQFLDFLKPYVEKYTKTPDNSTISNLCETFDDKDEACKWLVMMFYLFSFSETAVVYLFFPQFMQTILSHPEQFQKLRNNPSLMGSAIEEVLRYSTSRFTMQRQAYQDIEIGGNLFRAGEKITLQRDAANRDPEIFDNPDVFDITRQNNRHIAFLSGRHSCLGAAFTRLIIPVTFNAIFKRFSKINLVDARMLGPRQWGYVNIACDT